METNNFRYNLNNYYTDRMYPQNDTSTSLRQRTTLGDITNGLYFRSSCISNTTIKQLFML